MTVGDAENIATIVRGSIRLNKDLEKLGHIAKIYTPKDYSTNRYQQAKVDLYLDLYNNCRNTNKLVYKGNGKFETKKRPKTYCRQLALWKTYVSMVEDNGIDTEDWTFDPAQTNLLNS